MGCSGPVAYRMKENGHKKREKNGRSDFHLPQPFETSSPPLSATVGLSFTDFRNSHALYALNG